jgi:hypothetical protein
MEIFVYDYDVLGPFIMVFLFKGFIADGAQKVNRVFHLFFTSTSLAVSPFPI